MMPCYQGEGDDDDVEVYVWNERLATYVFVPEDETLVERGHLHRVQLAFGLLDLAQEFSIGKVLSEITHNILYATRH